MIFDLLHYTEEINKQRQLRQRALLDDLGWFTLAGLFWLKEGENRFGAAPENDVILPGIHPPDFAGAFWLHVGKVTVNVAPGVALMADGAPVESTVLRSDRTGDPTLVTLGNLTMLLIERGGRYGIRLYDKESRARQKFAGLRWYAVDPAYRIVARFDKHEPSRRIQYADVLGDIHGEESPGTAVFSWEKHQCRLVGLARGERLFFNFRDLTNGDTTYSAGRFLYTAAPHAGEVLLDFNLATNPYCAYTPYATCPLSPAENRLPIRIEAGEMGYQAAEASVV